MNKGAAVISIALAAVLGFVVGSITTQGARTASVNPEEAAANGANGPRQEDAERIPVGNSPVIGPNNALVTMVIFSDFECPFCQRVEDTIRQVRQRYGNDLRVVWKNNPLPFHNSAMPAAEASIEAMAQQVHSGFWRMHGTMFQNRANLTRPDLERYAQQQGLDMTRFRAALDRHTHQAAIQADMALATRLNAQGTPNMFINGTNLVGAQPLERFTALIDRVLAQARTITPRNRVYAQMVANPVTNPDEPARPNQPNQPNQPQQPPRQELDPATVYRVPVGNSPVQGPADALVTMIVFSDFECPFCGRVEDTVRAMRERYGADLRVVWKNRPLDFHQHAMPAAEAAMEAMAQQSHTGFWRMHATLFAHNTGEGLARPALEQYAQEQGLNMARFRAALDGHTHQAAIQEDVRLADSIAANGTPHFFINGRRLVGAQPAERFQATIDQARTDATNLLRTAGVTRANVYERLIANAATAPVYQGGGAAAAPGQPAAPAEDRVYTIRPNPNAPARGPANARVVLEHFSDFQCPFCSRVNPAIEQVMQQYEGRVRLVWRDYPLPFHDHAMEAAEAGREAAAQQGPTGFWRFHHTLFQNQTALTRADLERYAEAQGLNMARFRAALDAHTHQAGVRDDMAAADAAQAQDFGTPATFINGRLVSGAQPLAEFTRRIDAALAAPAAPGGRPAAAPAAARPAAAPAAH